MTKIKNWKRVQSKEKGSIKLFWKHDYLAENVRVAKTPLGYKMIVTYFAGAGAWQRQATPLRGGYDSLKEARQDAIKYMKTHPEG